MRFWVVQAQENPPEPATPGLIRREWRSNSLAAILAARGHEVVRWRSSFSHQKKQQLPQTLEQDDVDGYVCRHIYGSAYKRHVGIARLRNHFELGKNFSRMAYASKQRPDLIHVGNVPPELCRAVVNFANAYDIPVVVDVRDLWPDTYVDFLPNTLNFAKNTVRELLRIISVSTRRSYKDATAFSALSRSYLDWAAKMAGRELVPNDVILPMCHPKVATEISANEAGSLQKKLNLQPDDVVVSYAGNLGYQSDFDTIIECARLANLSTPNLKFVLAGTGPLMDELREKTTGLSNVILPGWLSGSDLRDLLITSTFGLVAYKNTPNFMLNIPNKFAEYLASGLILACCVSGEMATLIENNGCGFLYEQGDAQGLFEAIIELLSDQKNMAEISQAALNLHERDFDSAVVYPKFALHLERLANGGG